MSEGLTVVDKPAGMTSHDVVARMRRLAHTRRVGHAGTLDPMATGVLVVGIGSATRLLHHLVLTDKSYTATVRLGASTVTDDAEGEVLTRESAAALTERAVREAMTGFVGELDQVPSSVSAVKVDGRRAYDRVRTGEQVDLAARRVQVDRFDLLGVRRPSNDVFDVDVAVECSSGTYVRALARDLGAGLGVGGHLTALRRTRVGPFDLDSARTLEQVAAADDAVTLPLPDAVRAALATRDVSPAESRELSFGRSLEPTGSEAVVGAIAPGGEAVALLRDEAGRDGVLRARPVVVFAPAG